MIWESSPVALRNNGGVIGFKCLIQYAHGSISMAADIFYDQTGARKTMKWLKGQITEIRKLGQMGNKAMSSYDLDSADAYSRKIQEILDRIKRKKIVIRDQAFTLVDFPALINDMPAYLCWKEGEVDVAYWHYADEGFAGRKKITGEEKILSYL
jgi:hypothetical protein